MLEFIEKIRQKRKIRQKIALLQAKAELAKAKAAMQQQTTKQKAGKYAFFLKDIEAQKEIADRLMEDYEEGGFEKLLEYPIVQQLIKAYIYKQKGGGLEISDREKKVQEIINTLPPNTVKKITKLLKTK